MSSSSSSCFLSYTIPIVTHYLSASCVKKSGSMNRDHSLHEPLAIEQSVDAKRSAEPVNYMDAALIFILFCLFNFCLAVMLLWNASTMMQDYLDQRMTTTFTFLIGICVQIHSVCGSQALSIFGLCLILGLMVLKWTGRVTVVGITVGMSAMILSLGITGLSGMICEFSLVMTSGPSKLRSEMLRILVYGFIGIYVLVSPVIFYVVCSFYKRNHDEGREVPWFFSAIAFRILETMNTFNVVSLMTKARYLPINAFLTYYTFQSIQNHLLEVHIDFLHGTSYDCGRKRPSVQLAITGVIMVSTVLSIIASSRPTFSKLGAIYYRDMRLYMTSLFVIFYAVLATKMILFLIQQATGCSAGNWSIVRKPVLFTVFTSAMCACFYYKESIALWSHNDFDARPPPPTEATTLLVHTGCESQSTDRCTPSLLKNTTANSESWGLTGSTAVTGTSRSNTSYQPLLDSE